MKKQFIIAAAVAINLIATDKAQADPTWSPVPCPSDLSFSIENNFLSVTASTLSNFEIGWRLPSPIELNDQQIPLKINNNCSVSGSNSVDCTGFEATHSEGGFTDPNHFNYTNLQCTYDITAIGTPITISPYMFIDAGQCQAEQFKSGQWGFNCLPLTSARPENKHKKH